MRLRVPLGWNNLIESPVRLAASIGGVAFAVLLMFVEMGFLHGLYDSQTFVVKHLNADLLIVHPHKQAVVPTMPFPLKRVHQARGFPGVASAYPLYLEEYRASWKNSTDGRAYPILVYGFEPDDPVFDLPGSTIRADLLKKLDTALIDGLSKDFYGRIAADVSGELNGRRLHIVGTFSLGPDFRADGNLLVSAQTFTRCFSRPGVTDELARIDFGLVKVEPGADLLEVRDSLRAGLPGDVSVLTKDEFAERVKSYWGNSKPVGYIFGMGTAVGFLIGVTICYQILYSGVVNRLPQYATLKAIGYQNGYLVKVVLTEAIYLSLLGFIPGLLASWSVYRLLESYSGILMILTLHRVMLVLVLTVAMCAISGHIAVRRAVRSDPCEVF